MADIAPQRSSRLSLRVGILGAASIVNKTWPALHRAGHVVTYVGCRDTAKAQSLVNDISDKLGLAQDCRPLIGLYDDVVRSPLVDVVYVPLPVALRDHWVRESIRYGKHVVGEKPAAANAGQLLQWLDAMNSKRLLYMDGTMFTHGTRIKEIKRVLSTLGALQHIDIQFCFVIPPDKAAADIRSNPGLEPHGALGDLGWYCIRWILHLVGFALPVKVSGRVTEVLGTAIAGFEGLLHFDLPTGPATAAFYCSFTSGYEQTVRVLTTDAVLTVHSAINPTAEDRPRFTVTRTAWAEADDAHRPTTQVTSSDEVVYSLPEEENQGYQIEQLWRDVAGSLMRLGKDEPIVIDPEKGRQWGSYAYATQLVLDQLLQAAETAKADAAAVATASEDDKTVSSPKAPAN